MGRSEGMGVGALVVGVSVGVAVVGACVGAGVCVADTNGMLATVHDLLRNVNDVPTQRNRPSSSACVDRKDLLALPDVAYQQGTFRISQ